VPRAIYGLIKSCRGTSCNKDMLTSILLNNIFASRTDLRLVSNNFCGRFRLSLEGSSFRIDAVFNEGVEEPLDVKVYGSVERVNAFYAPSHRLMSLSLTPIASYGIEISAALRGFILALVLRLTGKAKEMAQQLERLISVQLEYYKDLYTFLKPILSMFSFDPKVQKALLFYASLQLLDLVIVLHIVEKGEEIYPW